MELINNLDLSNKEQAHTHLKLLKLILYSFSYDLIRTAISNFRDNDKLYNSIKQVVKKYYPKNYEKLIGIIIEYISQKIQQGLDIRFDRSSLENMFSYAGLGNIPINNDMAYDLNGVMNNIRYDIDYFKEILVLYKNFHQKSINLLNELKGQIKDKEIQKAFLIIEKQLSEFNKYGRLELVKKLKENKISKLSNILDEFFDINKKEEEYKNIYISRSFILSTIKEIKRIIDEIENVEQIIKVIDIEKKENRDEIYDKYLKVYQKVNDIIFSNILNMSEALEVDKMSKIKFNDKIKETEEYEYRKAFSHYINKTKYFIFQGYEKTHIPNLREINTSILNTLSGTDWYMYYLNYDKFAKDEKLMLNNLDNLDKLDKVKSNPLIKLSSFAFLPFYNQLTSKLIIYLFIQPLFNFRGNVIIRFLRDLIFYGFYNGLAKIQLRGIRDIIRDTGIPTSYFLKKYVLLYRSWFYNKFKLRETNKNIISIFAHKNLIEKGLLGLSSNITTTDNVKGLERAEYIHIDTALTWKKTVDIEKNYILPNRYFSSLKYPFILGYGNLLEKSLYNDMLDFYNKRFIDRIRDIYYSVYNMLERNLSHNIYYADKINKYYGTNTKLLNSLLTSNTVAFIFDAKKLITNYDKKRKIFIHNINLPYSEHILDFIKDKLTHSDYAKKIYGYKKTFNEAFGIRVVLTNQVFINLNAKYNISIGKRIFKWLENLEYEGESGIVEKIFSPKIKMNNFYLMNYNFNFDFEYLNEKQPVLKNKVSNFSKIMYPLFLYQYGYIVDYSIDLENLKQKLYNIGKEFINLWNKIKLSTALLKTPDKITALNNLNVKPIIKYLNKKLNKPKNIVFYDLLFSIIEEDNKTNSIVKKRLLNFHNFLFKIPRYFNFYYDFGEFGSNILRYNFPVKAPTSHYIGTAHNLWLSKIRGGISLDKRANINMDLVPFSLLSYWKLNKSPKFVINYELKDKTEEDVKRVKILNKYIYNPNYEEETVFNPKNITDFSSYIIGIGKTVYNAVSLNNLSTLVDLITGYFNQQGMFIKKEVVENKINEINKMLLKIIKAHNNEIDNKLFFNIGWYIYNLVYQHTNLLLQMPTPLGWPSMMSLTLNKNNKHFLVDLTSASSNFLLLPNNTIQVLYVDYNNVFSYEPASFLSALILPNSYIYLLYKNNLLPDWVKEFYKQLGWNPFRWEISKNGWMYQQYEKFYNYISNIISEAENKYGWGNKATVIVNDEYKKVVLQALENYKEPTIGISTISDFVDRYDDEDFANIVKLKTKMEYYNMYDMFTKIRPQVFFLNIDKIYKLFNINLNVKIKPTFTDKVIEYPEYIFD